MTLREMVEPQIIAEVGPEIWYNELIPDNEMLMYAQKWGLRIPILTQSEMYLIHREDMKCRKSN